MLEIISLMCAYLIKYFKGIVEKLDTERSATAQMCVVCFSGCRCLTYFYFPLFSAFLKHRDVEENTKT